MPVSRPAVSQHLRVLKDAGLVTDSKVGTRRYYKLDPEGVARLRAHFDQVWEKALGAFQVAAEKPPAGESNVRRTRRQPSFVRVFASRLLSNAHFQSLWSRWKPGGRPRTTSATRHSKPSLLSLAWAAVGMNETPKASKATGAKCSSGILRTELRSAGTSAPVTISPTGFAIPIQPKPAKWKSTSPRKALHTTLVELVHSKLERHGEGYEQLRIIFESPGAWTAILTHYAQRVDGRESE